MLGASNHICEAATAPLNVVKPLKRRWPFQNFEFFLEIDAKFFHVKENLQHAHTFDHESEMDGVGALTFTSAKGRWQTGHGIQIQEK